MAHLAKYHAEACGHMFVHYDRAYSAPLERPNVDASRSLENWVVGQYRDNRDLMRMRDEVARESGRKVRADAVVMADWVITAPTDLRAGDERRFFDAAYAFLEGRYGRENCLGGRVHVDEPGARPHMHAPIAPIVARDGRRSFSAKAMFTRQDLRTFHKDLGRAVDEALGYHVSVELTDQQRGRKQLSRLGHDEYAAATAEVSRAKREAEGAREGAAQASLVAEKARDEAAAAERTRDAVKGEIGALEGRRDALRDEIERTRRAWGTPGETVEIRRVVPGAPGRVAKVVRERVPSRPDLEAEAARLRGEVERLRGEAADASKGARAASEELEGARRDLRAAKGARDEAEASRRSAEAMRDAAEDARRSAESARAAAAADARAGEAEAGRLRAEVERLRGERDGLRGQVDGLRADVEDMPRSLVERVVDWLIRLVELLRHTGDTRDEAEAWDVACGVSTSDVLWPEWQRQRDEQGLYPYPEQRMRETWQGWEPAGPETDVPGRDEPVR